MKANKFIEREMVDEKYIINRLKELGKELNKQDCRYTAQPFWVDKENNSEVFSFFESDVEGSERNYVKCNYRATKMNELFLLLIHLSKN